MNEKLKARLGAAVRGLIVFLILAPACAFAHVAPEFLKPTEKPQKAALTRYADSVMSDTRRP